MNTKRIEEKNKHPILLLPDKEYGDNFEEDKISLARALHIGP
jgi:hypothetical protein